MLTEQRTNGILLDVATRKRDDENLENYIVQKVS